MNNIQVILEELEAPHHAASDTGQDILGHTGCLKFVERTSIHVLHAVVDTRFNEESAIKVHDFRRYCTMQNIELHNDSIKFSIFQLQADFLRVYFQ
jgi:hypothetical protein